MSKTTVKRTDDKLLLVVDIGNTKIALGVLQQGNLLATWRIATNTERLEDEYTVLLLDLMVHKGIKETDIGGVALCSVVPPLTPVFEEISKARFGINPLVVSAGVKTGVRIRMDNPREVGADRIAHAVAGHRLYGSPLIIIDSGTATVCDVVSREGDYLGGTISPGMGIAAEALSTHTAQLPRIKLTRPATVIGKNTITAMQSGIVYGYTGLIEGLITRISQELGDSPTVIATGGLAKLLGEMTPMIKIVDPNLTLKGIYFIYEMNRS